MKQSSLIEHLPDIDFRSREERQTNAIEEFKQWYEILAERQAIRYDDRLQAQLAMLSAVLWHLLPKSEYKKLTKRDAV